MGLSAEAGPRQGCQARSVARLQGSAHNGAAGVGQWGRTTMSELGTVGEPRADGNVRSQAQAACPYHTSPNRYGGNGALSLCDISHVSARDSILRLAPALTQNMSKKPMYFDESPSFRI